MTKLLTLDFLRSIEDIISVNPGFTLKQIKTELEKMNIANRISLSTIDRGLRTLLITCKRSHRELDRVNQDSYIEQRKNYSLWVHDTFSTDYSAMIFVDESSFNLHLRRQQARSRRGTRANIIVPVVRGRSITLISSVSISGMMYSKTITASTVNAEIFNEYVRELCVFLRDVKNVKNACIILDNARVHRARDLLSTTQQFGFTFKFLAPYSTCLIPLKQLFQKSRIWLKKFCVQMWI